MWLCVSKVFFFSLNPLTNLETIIEYLNFFVSNSSQIMPKNEIDLDVLELESSMIFHPAKEYQSKKIDSTKDEPPHPQNLSKTKSPNVINVNFNSRKAKLIVEGSNNKKCCKPCFSSFCRCDDSNCLRIFTILVLSILLVVVILMAILIPLYFSQTKTNENNLPIASNTTLFINITTPRATTSIPLVNNTIRLSNLVELSGKASNNDIEADNFTKEVNILSIYE